MADKSDKQTFNDYFSEAMGSLSGRLRRWLRPQLLLWAQFGSLRAMVYRLLCRHHDHVLSAQQASL
jgi:hypothetical protein